MIELESLCRDFQVGDQVVHALDDVNLTIDSGEYLSIMGPSGSGKSTLLNILGLLDTPTAGSYTLDDVNTSLMGDDQLAEVRQNRIGFIFQAFHLIARMSALENIILPMVLAGLPSRDRDARGRDAIDSVGLLKRADHRPDQLSGGERQRIAMARAVVMRPQLLLADEPTGNLDSIAGKEVLEIMENLNDQGLTLVMVTHDPAVGRRAQRRVVMKDGKIAEDNRD
jgi:putative ABC transport system ATP-binding protein